MSPPSASNPAFSNVDDVWDYLARKTDYERMAKFGKGRVEWNLQTIRRLVAAIGRPDRFYRIVHVGGSKGKGSTARLIRQALSACTADDRPLKVGLYTSPHVDHALERVEIDGRSLESDDFVRLMNRLHDPIEAFDGAPDADGVVHTPPTFFEIFTALALLAFAEAEVDVAVLEVGLGGRYDATNVVGRPDVTVLTSVSRDHTHLLGDTIAEIAADKAGMIRAGVPVVTGVRPGEAGFAPIVAAAREKGAAIRVREVDFGAANYRPTASGAEVDLWSGSRRLERLALGAFGAFQAKNAAVALAALDALAATGGPEATDDAIRDAWSHVVMPGRFETYALEDDRTLVLDGAHNHASAVALLASLDAHFPGRPINLVFAVAGDKLVDETALPLFRRARRVVVTKTDNPRSMTGERLERLARESGLIATPAADARTAIDVAIAGSAPGELVCATGSLYLVGELRGWLRDAGDRVGSRTPTSATRMTR